MSAEPLERLEARMRAVDERAVRDREAFDQLDPDQCMLCGAEGQDKRSLFMRCFYDMKEVVPELLDSKHLPDWPEGGYYARICKDCRGLLLGKLKEWREACRAKRGRPMDHDGHLEVDEPERNIPVRIHGRIVLLTYPEWEAWDAERQVERQAAEPEG